MNGSAFRAEERRFISKGLLGVTLALLLGCAQGGGDSGAANQDGQVGQSDIPRSQDEEQNTAEGEEAPSAENIAQAEAENQQFEEPNYPSHETGVVLDGYKHLDPQRLVPTGLLQKAVLYYDANKARLGNTKVLSVIDFGQHSSKKRFFIINMKTGSVLALHVAHGSGSDRNHDGIAEKFSNQNGSNATSIGVYKAAETYYGKWGYSLRLDGLSPTNSNARRRAIVIHAATYVKDAAVKQGRSWGCPAVPMKYRELVMNTLKGGSIIYAGTSK